jgi:hypothetical protein
VSVQTPAEAVGLEDNRALIQEPASAESALTDAGFSSLLTRLQPEMWIDGVNI